MKKSLKIDLTRGRVGLLVIMIKYLSMENIMVGTILKKDINAKIKSTKNFQLFFKIPSFM